ncbi:uncharacterized protein LOC125848957 [Solanum stenotomum]|uniref:uncharacterized protein LOC125848957 n=1 Tax=Solanum stenotomum TaxID=172797 RepID=UPI0020D1A463|nr:uncharacterized protein LOC125848957 [Solanum stenotomum]
MERKWYKKMTTMLLVLLVTIIKVQEVIGALECNGTNSSIGACLPDVDEFLMESETSTMILAGNARNQYLSFDAAGSRGEICKEDIYGNCIGNKNVKASHCTYGSRCEREISS